MKQTIIDKWLKKLIRISTDGLKLEVVAGSLSMLLMSGVMFMFSFIFKFLFPEVLEGATQYFFFCSVLTLLFVYGSVFLDLSVRVACHLFTWVAISGFLYIIYESTHKALGIDDDILFLSLMLLMVYWPFFSIVTYLTYSLVYLLLIVVAIALQNSTTDVYNSFFLADIDEIFLRYFVLLGILLVGKILFHFTDVASLSQRFMLEEQLKENRKEHFKLYKRAYYDFLTGLYNRMMMEEQIRYSIKHAEADESSLGLLFIDLDDFKEINDQYGHKSGDECLIEAARRFNRRFEKSKSIDEQHNFVARISGDEFIVVLVGISQKRMIKLCEELLSSCVPLLKLSTIDEKVKLTFSIGAYRMAFNKKANMELFNKNWKELRMLLFTIADRNMYRAKYKKNSYYITEYTNKDYEVVKNFGM